MELESLREFASKADPKQLEAIGFMAQWLSEMSPRYCTCKSQCSKTCPVVKGMGEAFQTAASKL